MNVSAVHTPTVVRPMDRTTNSNQGVVPPWLRDPEPVRTLPMPDGWDDGNTLPVEPVINSMIARQIDTAFEPWPIEG